MPESSSHRYNHSEKGKLARSKYNHSEKGKLNRDKGVQNCLWLCNSSLTYLVGHLPVIELSPDGWPKRKEKNVRSRPASLLCVKCGVNKPIHSGRHCIECLDAISLKVKNFAEIEM